MAWISWVNVVLGVWLGMAAFVFRHATGTGVTEDVIAGLFVALAALWAARAFRPVASLIASWVVVLSGAWVVGAPFTLGYQHPTVAVANDLCVGLAIVALAGVNTWTKAHRRAPSPGPA